MKSKVNRVLALVISAVIVFSMVSLIMFNFSAIQSMVNLTQKQRQAIVNYALGNTVTAEFKRTWIPGNDCTSADLLKYTHHKI